MQKLQALQHHPNSDVYNKVISILETFYVSYDEIDDGELDSDILDFDF